MEGLFMRTVLVSLELVLAAGLVTNGRSPGSLTDDKSAHYSDNVLLLGSSSRIEPTARDGGFNGAGDTYNVRETFPTFTGSETFTPRIDYTYEARDGNFYGGDFPFRDGHFLDTTNNLQTRILSTSSSGNNIQLGTGSDISFSSDSDNSLSPGSDISLSPGSDISLSPHLSSDSDISLSPGSDISLSTGSDVDFDGDLNIDLNLDFNLEGNSDITLNPPAPSVVPLNSNHPKGHLTGNPHLAGNPKVHSTGNRKVINLNGNKKFTLNKLPSIINLAPNSRANFNIGKNLHLNLNPAPTPKSTVKIENS
ncbi:unnamed protein product, partial [Allacma fusca]